MMDGIGIYGMVLQYALVFALFFSALLFFFYFWRKKRLDFDEGPKYEMLAQESSEVDDDK